MLSAQRTLHVAEELTTSACAEVPLLALPEMTKALVASWCSTP